MYLDTIQNQHKKKKLATESNMNINEIQRVYGNGIFVSYTEVFQQVKAIERN